MESERLVRLYVAGLSAAQVAAELGLDPQAVRDTLREHGYYPAESKRRLAGISNANAARERRRRLEDNQLTIAERLQGQVFAPHEHFKLHVDGSVTTHTTPEPTPVDKLRLVQATRAALESAQALSAWGGADPRVASILEATAEAMGLTDGE